MIEPAVIVIAKTPVAGAVKTRCCPPCTPAQAADLAAAALADTLDVVLASSAPRRVVALHGAPGDWLPGGFDVVAQREGSLGSRIDGAFVDVGAPAVLIGMDTPQLTVERIDEALEILRQRTSDAVVGRAVDGGFWALGLTSPARDLCRDVPMSLPTTCSELHDALRTRDLAWHSLGELEDVDDFATACNVAADLPGSRFATAVDMIVAGLGVMT